MLYQESDLDVIVGGERTIAEGMGAKWVDGQGIKATRRTVVDEVWNHPKDIALPFPFTLAQFRAFCDWHPSFEWEAIESPFTNDDDTLDEAALSELAIRGADAAKLVRQFLGVRGGAPAFEILPQAVAKTEPPSENPEAQGQGFGKGEIKTLKKADLIDRLKKSWESIERDLKETSKSGYEGLADARIRYGIYDVDKAIKWAKQNGRWKESTTPLTQRMFMSDLPVSKINKPDW